MQKVIERILNLLAFLLTVDRPVTADEIRHTVKGYDQPSDEAFRRTFERDKDLLRSLGVPLETTYTDIWEVELGYVVPSDAYTLEDPHLTDEERSALLLAAEAVRFGGQPTELDALFKLGGATRAVSAGPVLADLGADLDLLGTLFSAVTDRRLVDFGYRGRDRMVMPYGMVHRFGHWYLVGPERRDPSVVKAFRLDRMEDPSVRDERHVFERPDGFDASDALADLRDDPGSRTAVIRFDNDVVGVALHSRRGARILDEGDATTTVEVPVGAPRSLITWLLGFDDRALIESPPDLRDAFTSFVGITP